MKSKQRHEIIKKLIQEHAIEDQQTLLNLMQEQYRVNANQATVSRDLRALGVHKKQVGSTMVYDLPAHDASKEILRLAVVQIAYNSALIVIHTLPGLAAFVGDYLDMQKDNLMILGTIAGENTIFVTPTNTKQIELVYKKLCGVLYVKQNKPIQGSHE